MTKDSPRRILITATPPTPNGDLHVGHLSGPYLGADIYRRYVTLKNVEHYYVSGADDHQSYVAFKGEQMEWQPSVVADHFGDAMQKTLEAANIELQLFARPRTSAYHIPMVEAFFRKLYAEDKFIVKETESLFCHSCNRHVFEAFISGKCPHCQSPSGGNACEDCGQPNDCVDLIQPICKRCGSRPGTAVFRRLYFPLSRYEKQLRQYYGRLKMNPHVRALCEQMLLNGLPDISITHVAEWGIPVPVPGFEGQKLYVWFEMAPGYLAETSECFAWHGIAGDWTDVWKSRDASVVQFFGFDNSYFHAVLFPALFMAYDPEIRLADILVTNEFYRLDGLKFSTSRNHAIWGRDLIGRCSADATRFYLAYTGPEREQANFTLDDFWRTVDRELLGGWESWIQAVGRKVEAVCRGVVPPMEAPEQDQQEFVEQLRRFVGEAESAYSAETFSPQSAARTCCELIRVARRFGHSENHWELVRGRERRRHTSLALELLAAKLLALLSAPLTPVFAKDLWTSLGFSTPMAAADWSEAVTPVPAGQATAGLNSLQFPGIHKQEAKLVVA